MAVCRRLETCNYFRVTLAQMPNTVEIFKRSFCTDDYESCARYMLLGYLEEMNFNVSEEMEMMLDRISPTLAPGDREKVKIMISQ